MGMVLHGVADDVGHFVVASVVEGLHGVQDSALHGFEPVVDMRHSSLENNVACVFEIPVAEHSGEHCSFVLEIFCHGEGWVESGCKGSKKKRQYKAYFSENGSKLLIL